MDDYISKEWRDEKQAVLSAQHDIVGADMLQTGDWIVVANDVWHTFDTVQFILRLSCPQRYTNNIRQWTQDPKLLRLLDNYMHHHELLIQRCPEEVTTNLMLVLDSNHGLTTACSHQVINVLMPKL
ncbi:hypothetical protein ABBQ38_012220 [Trebouxia sp. C0009 RCD-2024]